VLEDVLDEVLTVEEEELSRREDAEPGKSFTRVLAGQRPISYVILFLTEDGEVVGEYRRAADTQLLEMFYLDLADARTGLVPLLNVMAYIRPHLRAEQEDDFLSASTCWICEQEYVIPGEGTDDRVRNHAHSSLQGGRYIGAAHRSCNSARQHQREIPIFIHNFQNYDANFILEGFQHDHISKSFKLKALATNTEKFCNIHVGCFNFLDSFHFLRNSLSGLIQKMRKDRHEFHILNHFRHEHLDGNVAADKELLLRKGVFPYELIRSVRQMSEMRDFPERSKFYSRLTEKNITAEDHEHGLRVYQAARCSNFEEYAMLYNRLDVYLLASAVMLYRNMVYAENKLDVSQFLSKPHLAFNIALLTKEEKVKLVTDIDMHLMVSMFSKMNL
jgi:hypothetical protein